MSVSIGRLRYDIVADTSGFTKGILSARSELALAKRLFIETRSPAENLSAAIQKLDGMLAKKTITLETHRRAVARLNADYKTAASTVSSTGKAFAASAISVKDAAAAFVGFRAAGAVLGEVSGAFQLANQIEATTQNFEVLTGSAQVALDLVEDLRQYDLKTTFQFSDTVNAAEKLLNFGVAAEDVLSNLKALGDVSMGNAERLSRLSLAFGQATAMGKLMGAEVRQMVEAGFNPLQEIARKSGQSMEQVRLRMEDGAVSAHEMAAAFRSATSEGGRFFGMVEKRAETLAGQIDMLKGEWAMLKVELAQEATPIARVAVKESREGIKFWSDAFDQYKMLMDNRFNTMYESEGGRVLGNTPDTMQNPIFDKILREYEQRLKQASWDNISGIGETLFGLVTDAAMNWKDATVGGETNVGIATNMWVEANKLYSEIAFKSREELERIKQEEQDMKKAEELAKKEAEIRKEFDKQKQDIRKGTPLPNIGLAPSGGRGSRDEYRILAEVANKRGVDEAARDARAQEIREKILAAEIEVRDAIRDLKLAEAI